MAQGRIRNFERVCKYIDEEVLQILIIRSFKMRG
jgi:hypothetical protein